MISKLFITKLMNTHNRITSSVRLIFEELKMTDLEIVLLIFFFFFISSCYMQHLQSLLPLTIVGTLFSDYFDSMERPVQSEWVSPAAFFHIPELSILGLCMLHCTVPCKHTSNYLSFWNVHQSLRI